MSLGWQWVKQRGRDLLGNGIRAMSEYHDDFGLVHLCVSIFPVHTPLVLNVVGELDTHAIYPVLLRK